MSWTYEQSSGRLRNPSGATIGVGYSGGDCGLQPKCVNNPAMEGLVNCGPIVCGNYTRGTPIEVDPKLGKYVIPLIPDMATRAKIIAYGRNPDTFYMHGDDIAKAGQQAASDGCIVQVLTVRQEFGTSSDDELQVIPGPSMGGIADLNGEISV